MEERSSSPLNLFAGVCPRKGPVVLHQPYQLHRDDRSLSRFNQQFLMYEKTDSEILYFPAPTPKAVIRKLPKPVLVHAAVKHSPPEPDENGVGINSGAIGRLRGGHYTN
ncbi:hypothetical protein AAGS40_22605 [Paraburkholderia sp. PREW-6R]|uniref:hypothetical protein n=1 Tax=Paraburkholderia sp. PREW-6R TaxID=3141544 RepID=UPI0031F52C8F